MNGLILANERGKGSQMWGTEKGAKMSGGVLGERGVMQVTRRGKGLKGQGVEAKKPPQNRYVLEEF